MNKLLYTTLIIAGVAAIAIADILLKKAAGAGSYISALKHPFMPVVVLLYLFQVAVFLFVFVKRVDLSTVGVLQTALYAVIVLGAGILFTIFFVFSTLAAAVITGGNLTTGNIVVGLIIVFAGVLAIFSIPLSISAFLAWRYASTSRNLQLQLEQVAALSEKTLRQEKEKQQILENQKAAL